VIRVPTEETAAQRARWLGELSSALEEAQGLIWRISSAENLDLLDLSAQIESARAEVRSLRLGRGDHLSSEHDPEWTDQSPWDHRDDAPGG
jgi:hypothetical protein